MSLDRPTKADLALLVTLAGLGVVAFTNGGRTWGIDAWNWFSPVTALGLLALGVAGAWAFGQIARGKAKRRWGIAQGAVLLGLGALFVLLRSRAHFLGDGYQNLSLLAEERPLMKPTAYGTIRILLFLRDAFGGGEAGILAAYRVVSIGSGAMFLLVAALAARRLFEDPFLRFGFVAILATQGSSLLFFGYVENYAPFVLVVEAYSLLGLFASRTVAARVAAATLVGIAAFLHQLGLVLLPSLAILLFAPQRVPRTFRNAAIVVAVVAVILGVRAWRDSLSLQFLLVPPTPDSRFVIDGYSLFSAAHLLDVANLLVLLLPGILGLMAAAMAAPRRLLARGPGPFLVVLNASALGAVFLLDPKLGMPRDWDVFAFAGAPLATGLAWAWAKAARRRPALRPAGLTAALLGLLVLVPRAVVLTDADRAIEPFRAYLELDLKRGRNARIHLVNHYRDQGLEEEMNAELQVWLDKHPERRAVLEGRQARNEGRYVDAIRLNRQAILLNPQYYDAYNNLADCLLMLEEADAAIAILRIALVLGPLESAAALNLGTAYMMKGNMDSTEVWWRRAYFLNPDGYHENRSLAILALKQERYADYERFLEKAAAFEEADADIKEAWRRVLESRAEAASAEAAPNGP